MNLLNELDSYIENTAGNYICVDVAIGITVVINKKKYDSIVFFEVDFNNILRPLRFVITDVYGNELNTIDGNSRLYQKILKAVVSDSNSRSSSNNEIAKANELTNYMYKALDKYFYSYHMITNNSGKITSNNNYIIKNNKTTVLRNSKYEEGFKVKDHYYKVNLISLHLYNRLHNKIYEKLNVVQLDNKGFVFDNYLMKPIRGNSRIMQNSVITFRIGVDDDDKTLKYILSLEYCKLDISSCKDSYSKEEYDRVESLLKTQSNYIFNASKTVHKRINN